jgi:hypothetical protein
MPNQFETMPICYAMSEASERLPVIDITHPAFAVEPSEAEIERMTREFIAENQQPRVVPEAIREALRQSRLGRDLIAASGSFLSGMATYLLKLGPDNLGEEAHPLDKRIAASLPAFMTRVRLQDVSRLLAEGVAHLSSAETADPADRRRPLRFINIAGGPAADSWNALIHLRATQPDLLVDRNITIAVLDIDTHGPAFGARAIDALRAPDAPLHGLDLGLRHVSYDWSRAADHLPAILDDLGAQDAACAISSEGGLFQYGSDADIIANLAALHAATPADAIVAGSVTRDDEAARLAQAASGVPTRPLSRQALQQLADTAGWSVAHVIERPFVYNVRLVKRDVS